MCGGGYFKGGMARLKAVPNTVSNNTLSGAFFTVAPKHLLSFVSNVYHLHCTCNCTHEVVFYFFLF